jgi:hypothetical protein
MRRRPRTARERKGISLACLGGAMMLLAGGATNAQEALRSELSYEQAVKPLQNPAVNLEPDQPHLGPVQLSLGAYTSIDFSDNINASQTDPQSDELLHAGVNAGMVWPATPLSSVTLSAGIGYAHYLKNSQNDSLEFQPNSSLNWNIFIEDVTLSLYDQFSFSQQVVTQGAVSDLTRFPIYNETAGILASWQPGHWEFSGGYSHGETFSTSSALTYLDRSSENFNLRGGWRFAENTEAGLEASASVTSYRVTTQPGDTSLSLGPFANWQITQAIHLTVRGGPTVYVFDSQPGSSQGSTLTSYYAQLTASHQLTPYMSHQISLNRQVSLGLNQGGSDIQEFTASYNASYALTPMIGLNASLSYDHGNQSFQNIIPIAPGFGLLLNQTEIYDLYSFSGGLSWQAAQRLSTGLSFNHYFRQSNLANRSYTADILTVRLSYAF